MEYADRPEEEDHGNHKCPKCDHYTRQYDSHANADRCWRPECRYWMSRPPVLQEWQRTRRAEKAIDALEKRVAELEERP